MANYRPISLLNSDYKILMKVLVGRFKGIGEKIIRSNQAYGVAGRDIADAILTAKAVFRGVGEEGGIILNLDFEKAFDRISDFYLFKGLEKVGCSGNFLRTLKGLYGASTSRLKVNGYVSKAFKINCSVRQGCPLSPLLFSVALETLVTAIEEDRGLGGLRVSPSISRVKIIPFADDVTICMKNVQELEIVMKYVNFF